MKKIIFLIAIVATTACTNQAKHEEQGSNEMKTEETKTDSKMEKSENENSITVQKSDAVTPILDSYLELKDALVSDNSDKAAEAGKKLMGNLGDFDINANANGKIKEVTDIIKDATENAEHISENADKMEHQREHLELLSADIKDLVAITGADRTLYEDFCPMYNDGEGAAWISATNEIQNPYFGTKMQKCGRVQTEIKVK